MNSKVATYCRRLAEAMTVGTKPLGYKLDKRKKTIYVKGEPVQVEKGVIQLSPGCTRWVLRLLKRKYKRGELKRTNRFRQDLQEASDAVVEEAGE